MLYYFWKVFILILINMVLKYQNHTSCQHFKIPLHKIKLTSSKFQTKKFLELFLKKSERDIFNQRKIFLHHHVAKHKWQDIMLNKHISFFQFLLRERTYDKKHIIIYNAILHGGSFHICLSIISPISKKKYLKHFFPNKCEDITHFSWKLII